MHYYTDPHKKAIKPGALDSATMRSWARKQNMPVPRRGPVSHALKLAFIEALYKPSTA